VSGSLKPDRFTSRGPHQKCLFADEHPKRSAFLLKLWYLFPLRSLASLPSLLPEFSPSPRILSPWEFSAFLPYHQSFQPSRPAFIFGSRMAQLLFLFCSSREVHTEVLYFPKRFPRYFLPIQQCRDTTVFVPPRCPVDSSSIFFSLVRILSPGSRDPRPQAARSSAFPCPGLFRRRSFGFASHLGPAFA